MKNLRTFTCIAASLICALALTSLPVMAKDRVSQYDFDSDGKVSFDDINRYCTVSRNLFNHADKNKDGFLSNFEMRTAIRYLFVRCESRSVYHR